MDAAQRAIFGIWRHQSSLLSLTSGKVTDANHLSSETWLVPRFTSPEEPCISSPEARGNVPVKAHEALRGDPRKASPGGVFRTSL